MKLKQNLLLYVLIIITSPCVLSEFGKLIWSRRVSLSQSFQIYMHVDSTLINFLVFWINPIRLPSLWLVFKQKITSPRNTLSAVWLCTIWLDDNRMGIPRVLTWGHMICYITGERSKLKEESLINKVYFKCSINCDDNSCCITASVKTLYRSLSCWKWKEKLPEQNSPLVDDISFSFHSLLSVCYTTVYWREKELVILLFFLYHMACFVKLFLSWPSHNGDVLFNQ